MIDPIAHKAGQEAAAKQRALNALLPELANNDPRKARLQALATSNAGGIPTRGSAAEAEAAQLTDELVATLAEIVAPLAP